MYGELVTALAHLLWGWWFEVLVVVDFGFGLWLVAVYGGAPAAFALALLLAFLLTRGGARSRVRAAAWSRGVRRRWASAVRVAGPSSYRHGNQALLNAARVPAGDLLRVRIPLGSKVAELESNREALAAALGARDVRVLRDPSHAAIADVLVVRVDPLVRHGAQPWPWQGRLQTSLWEPIPVGVGEDGRPVMVALPERNVLLGGEPGAGKSAAMSLLVATAALDPTCHLWLLDGKLVELSTWRESARGTAGVQIGEAIDVLTGLRREMDARYGELLAHRQRKVSRDSGLPLHVVVCDELAHYLTTGDRKERAEFADLMRDLVSRGGAAGIIVVAATQKPSSDVIPTSLRDLFGFRWAMRCATPQASDTILGSGWASAGFSAAEVDAAHRGVGYLLHEGGTPVRLRSYYLDDAALDSLAVRASALREATAMGVS